jgi:hypothetical protein
MNDTIIHTQIYMKLTRKAIKGIKDHGARLKLALALGFSEQWIVRVIGANKSNGPLTTATALKVIRQETGLKDAEILEEEPVKAGS